MTPESVAIFAATSRVEKRVDGFQRAVERGLALLGQRRGHQPARPVGGIGAAGEPPRGRERLVEFRLPARMRVGIALHQPAQLDDAYCMRVVVPRDLARRGKPSVAMRGLALVAKEPAAETTQTTEDIKRKKPADGVGLHAAATIDHAVELLEQTRPRLDEAAERD